MPSHAALEGHGDLVRPGGWGALRCRWVLWQVEEGEAEVAIGQSQMRMASSERASTQGKWHRLPLDPMTSRPAQIAVAVVEGLMGAVDGSMGPWDGLDAAEG